MLLKAATNKRASSFFSKMLAQSSKRAFSVNEVQAFADSQLSTDRQEDKVREHVHAPTFMNL